MLKRTGFAYLPLLGVIFGIPACLSSTGYDRGEEIRQGMEAQCERASMDIAARRADERMPVRPVSLTASATISYWLRVKEILRPEPICFPQVASELDRLPTLEIDPDLVEQTQLLLDKIRAAMVSRTKLPESAFLYWLRLPRSSHIELDARCIEVVEQCRKVERMRTALTNRYGVEFPPLELDKHLTHEQ